MIFYLPPEREKPASALGRMAIPTPAECWRFMEQYGMLPHIREHSLLVTDAALWLTRGLISAGLTLNLPLIEAGALLHDLGKTPCLGTMKNHAEWGAQVLERLGYPAVAQIVREHVSLDEQIKDERPVREAEVVNYADKRVLHTRIVSLNQRFADLRERYGQNAEVLARIIRNEQRSLALEQKLFAYLPCPPDALLHLNLRRREP
jgi:uncharacterized protein|uniref:HD domain-containing protein n=1 Tax=Desulfobacca acetoxidans TaxID=60893 RepID=A0A7C3WLX3_9BACT